MSNVVHLMDCMEGMNQFPDKYFELAIVDPPYGINAGTMTMGSGNHKFNKYKVWDNQIPDKAYFDELFRISKNQIIWGGNYFTEYLKPSNDWVIWDKMNPNLSFSEAELAWCSIKRNTRIVKHYSAMVEDNGKIHPTQKAVKLYKWLLRNYANPGDKILDTHVGSGSSRIACYDGGFDFTGYEIDADYHAAQEKRFQQHIAQLQLFI